jgi:pimeloyl-ACP methyl ester carboxylesterase
MKQAVVVIHGIGEQRPMSMLREFVNAIIPEPNAKGRVKYRSKPDRMSKIFELRVLQSVQTRTTPITDFYEYYWAHHMEGTQFGHVLSWLKELLLHLPRNVPRRLLPIWVLAWVLVVAFALSSAGLLLPAQYLPLVLPWGGQLTIWLGSALLLPALQSLVLRYVGDAARYLRPVPGNIAIRRRVRADGIQLLRKLHNSGKYDRIIVVGHSLGSVIAYDMLCRYWQEVNTRIDHHLKPDQSALKNLEKLGRSLDATSSPAAIKQYQEAQWALWRSQRKLGNPWLISDLITLGTPLVHAEILLAKDKAELQEQQREKELPTCPPQAERNKYSYLVHYNMDDGSRLLPRSAHVLDHAALFACTRWTNLYFPGDFVGGPLAPVMGPGVADIQISGGGLVAHTPLSHTRYWRVGGKYEPSLRVLVAALRLQSKASLRKSDEPTIAGACAVQGLIQNTFD